MSIEYTNQITNMNIDKAKRDFMKRFGKYAATVPMGMYMLMGPGASKAQASGSSCSVKCNIHSGNLKWGQSFDFPDKTNPTWHVASHKYYKNGDWSLHLYDYRSKQKITFFYHNKTKEYFKLDRADIHNFPPKNYVKKFTSFESIISEENEHDNNLGMLLRCFNDFIG